MVGWYVLLAQKPVVMLRARIRYLQARAEKVDFERSPCLGKIDKDWMLDIAHLPRQEMDDFPENQCRDYREGKVGHFVEMTPKGEVIVIN